MEETSGVQVWISHLLTGSRRREFQLSSRAHRPEADRTACPRDALETHEVIAGQGVCLNDGTEIPYEEGTVSFFPAGVPHEVRAGTEGLSLFAKFFPALC